MAGRYSDIYSDFYEFETIHVGLASSSTDSPEGSTNTAGPEGVGVSSQGHTSSSTTAPRVSSSTSSN